MLQNVTVIAGRDKNANRHSQSTAYMERQEKTTMRYYERSIGPTPQIQLGSAGHRSSERFSANNSDIIN